jgi:hypothetical protein
MKVERSTPVPAEDSELQDPRSRLTAEKEDDVGDFLMPTKPSQLRALSDEELSRFLHKVAFANMWPISAKVQFETSARLIAALKDFKESSDRSAKVLVGLTIVLVILTAVLVWLTLRLS